MKIKCWAHNLTIKKYPVYMHEKIKYIKETLVHNFINYSMRWSTNILLKNLTLFPKPCEFRFL